MTVVVDEFDLDLRLSVASREPYAAGIAAVGVATPRAQAGHRRRHLRSRLRDADVPRGNLRLQHGYVRPGAVQRRDHVRRLLRGRVGWRGHVRRVPACRHRTAARISPTRNWQPVLAGEDAANALAVVRDVARRLSDPRPVELAVASARRSADFPRSIRWTDEGLWQGFAGLAVLSGALDACLPDEGWDRVGLDQLRRASAALEQRRHVPLGLARGLAGIGVAAWALSRGVTRYRRLLATLDASLTARVEIEATELVRAAASRSRGRHLRRDLRADRHRPLPAAAPGRAGVPAGARCPAQLPCLPLGGRS